MAQALRVSAYEVAVIGRQTLRGGRRLQQRLRLRGQHPLQHSGAIIFPARHRRLVEQANSARMSGRVLRARECVHPPQCAQRQQHFTASQVNLERQEVRLQAVQRVLLQQGQSLGRLTQRIRHRGELKASLLLFLLALRGRLLLLRGLRARHVLLLLAALLVLQGLQGLLLLILLGLLLEELLPRLALLPPLLVGRLRLRVAHHLLVGEAEVAPQGPACGAHIEAVIVHMLLHLEQRHVRAQRHLAQAVRVEVELVLHDVLKVLAHRKQLTERLAILLGAEMGIPGGRLVPDALHLVQIVTVVAVLGEQTDGFLRFGDHVRVQHV
mmetsp:Transcript_25665/g.42953  ORF Transcript_25665/g.42953 Transcript_25665/m.42953 type:complete len:325 (-) Transcript_25665:1584-2558(-)